METLAIEPYKDDLKASSRPARPKTSGCPDDREEFRNSHGVAPSAGTGTSYLCDSNCDMFNLTQ